MSTVTTPPDVSARVRAEVLDGHGVSLIQAARTFPPSRRTSPVNSSTIFRWIASGIRLPDGRRLRLEGVRLGGRWLTSKQALDRFITAQTPNLEAGDQEEPRSPSKQRRQSSAAEKELERRKA
jgi:hypothetical protein